MATAARDRLARTLRGGAQTAFSVEMAAKTDDLILDVEGFGRVKFPVTPAKARKLLSLGQPARFGRGEQTLTDPDVRDTWEIPKHLIRAQWNDATLKDMLAIFTRCWSMRPTSTSSPTRTPRRTTRWSGPWW
jgi:hypothetical protein